MSDKVALERAKQSPYAYKAPGHCETPLVKCLPFFKSKAGKLVHRVREGTIYWRNGEYSHTALKYWCGGNGFLDKGSALFAFPPPAEMKLCAICEARAQQQGDYE